MFKERNTMEEIQWKEPPTARSKNYPAGRYVAIANALRKRPEKWAVVSADTAGNLAVYIRQGKVKGFAPAGSFEAVSRVNAGYADRKTMRFTVYARFIG
jgi:hypothetical protein